MKNTTTQKLYMVAFGAFQEKAKSLKVTIKDLVKESGYRGKVLRRGIAGAFGFDLRPSRSAKTDRRGYNVAGNSRNRRFARRHPSRFSPA